MTQSASKLSSQINPPKIPMRPPLYDHPELEVRVPSMTWNVMKRMEFTVEGCSLVTVNWILVIGIGYRLSPIGYRLSAIGNWLFAIGYWLLAIGYWLLAIGYRLLAIGYWLLAIGFGYW